MKSSPEAKNYFTGSTEIPIILFAIATLYPFCDLVPFYPKRHGKAGTKKRVYNQPYNPLAFCSAGILLMGWKAFLMIQIPVIYIATVAGVWLFYVQHQFEDVIWTRQEDWDYQKMALEGSSFLKFPRLLQWFSGNIGYHHIHHLSPKDSQLQPGKMSQGKSHVRGDQAGHLCTQYTYHVHSGYGMKRQAG